MTNLKVTYKTTMGQGQSSESTTMIRGPRERSEMHLGPGMDIVSLTQCDLKRTVQFNDKARKYVVTPMEAGDSSSSGGAEASEVAPPPNASRGGGITYVMTSIDTVERKEMFRFN